MGYLMVVLDQPSRLATNSAYGYDIKSYYGRISRNFMKVVGKKIKVKRIVKTNRVRIIGGDWRSRLLKFPDAEGLRPTADRARETLFNWLGQSLDGYTCLDLFAGSGALGFEALSRGAAYVVLVEKQNRVYACLTENAQMLGAGDRMVIIRQDAFDFLSSSKKVFDLVFLDPPFGYGLVDRLLPKVVEHVKPGGLIYIESELEILPSEGMFLRRHVKSGMSHHTLLEVSRRPFLESIGS